MQGVKVNLSPSEAYMVYQLIQKTRYSPDGGRVPQALWPHINRLSDQLYTFLMGASRYAEAIAADESWYEQRAQAQEGVGGH